MYMCEWVCGMLCSTKTHITANRIQWKWDFLHVTYLYIDCMPVHNCIIPFTHTLIKNARKIVACVSSIAYATNVDFSFTKSK